MLSWGLEVVLFRAAEAELAVLAARSGGVGVEFFQGFLSFFFGFFWFFL